jgi:hypothetical protein
MIRDFIVCKMETSWQHPLVTEEEMGIMGINEVDF